jgi:hypothetical protein
MEHILLTYCLVTILGKHLIQFLELVAGFTIYLDAIETIGLGNPIAITTFIIENLALAAT